MNSQLPNNSLTSQLDPEVLERFLRLLGDKYRLADLANFHLEHNESTSGISVAITNQRDVVSHFITVLQKPGLTKNLQLQQLAQAEEHLRRAIIEPYELSINLCMKRFIPIYEEYKKEILPRAHETAFSSCPTMSSVQATVNRIADLRNEGRLRKAKNIWDSDWEDGVKSYVEAYQLARALTLKLETYLVRAKQLSWQDQTGFRIGRLFTYSRETYFGVRHLNGSHVWVAVICLAIGIGAEFLMIKYLH